MLFLLIACEQADPKITDETLLESEQEGTENNNSSTDQNRCCYTIKMNDSYADGWDQGYISVSVDDELHSEVTLPQGASGYQEICPIQGSNLEMTYFESNWNEEVSFMVFDPQGDMITDMERPQSGVFLDTNVVCDADVQVDPDYQEESSTDGWNEDQDDDGWDDNGWDDNQNTDVFENDYEAYFVLTNMNTDYEVCDVWLPVEIDGDGNLFSSGSCETENGYELSFTHQGFLLVQGGSGGGGGGHSSLQGDLFGYVNMEVPSGDVFETDFYGECYNESSYIGFYLYWEMNVQTPSSNRDYSGFMYVE
jgi:hypothetical protein